MILRPNNAALIEQKAPPGRVSLLGALFACFMILFAPDPRAAFGNLSSANICYGDEPDVMPEHDACCWACGFASFLPSALLSWQNFGPQRLEFSGVIDFQIAATGPIPSIRGPPLGIS